MWKNYREIFIIKAMLCFILFYISCIGFDSYDIYQYGTILVSVLAFLLFITEKPEENNESVRALIYFILMMFIPSLVFFGEDSEPISITTLEKIDLVFAGMIILFLLEDWNKQSKISNK